MSSASAWSSRIGVVASRRYFSLKLRLRYSGCANLHIYTARRSLSHSPHGADHLVLADHLGSLATYPHLIWREVKVGIEVVMVRDVGFGLRK